MPVLIAQLVASTISKLISMNCNIGVVSSNLYSLPTADISRAIVTDQTNYW